jgi:hypothetical protein
VGDQALALDMTNHALIVGWHQWNSGAIPMRARRYHYENGWGPISLLDFGNPWGYVSLVDNLTGGGAMAVWQQLTNPKATEYRCYDARDGWSDLVTVDPTGDYVDTLRVHANGRLLVADELGANVSAAIYAGGGTGGWCRSVVSPEIQLNDMLTDPNIVRELVDRGSPLSHFVWFEPQSGAIETRHFDHENLVWSDAALLWDMTATVQGFTYYWPLLASDESGNALVVAHLVSGSDGISLGSNHFDAELGQWTEELIYEEGPGRSLSTTHNKIAITNDGRAYLVVRVLQEQPGMPPELLAFSFDGTSWSEATSLGLTAGFYYQDYIKVDPVSGDLFVFWLDPDNLVDLRIHRYDAADATWTDASPVPESYDTYGLAKLEYIGDGKMMLIAVERTIGGGTPEHLVAMIHDGEGWQPSVTLEVDPTETLMSLTLAKLAK